MYAFAITAVVGALWGGEVGAAQQSACATHETMTKQLGIRYDETPVAFGLQSNGNLLEVYSSEEKGTWTAVSTAPNGMSCIVAAGKKWESLPYVSKDPMA